ncbi:DNA primase [Kineococcus xinjiangensis]|uniref:DNA primase n=1 Tax=Kineococcus xinjiangensis TaxID=512762 RepID=A0A2S6IIX8_9ACTN|nr:DNA primase [Kineococcus xinjiangensis]PPK94110.1 DNA primase [Kineococcus xinjiangensis]
MAGRINPDDLAAVKNAVRIDEVVGEHVALKPAGVGSMKGLCPFHDERSPSFNVRPQVGYWHCFGCGEGGDAISFLQRIESLSFVEAVERLAGRAGVQLRYIDDGGRPARPQVPGGQRQRLLEAHRVAAEHFAERLQAPGDPDAARRFLAERGFSREEAARFGVGFAPRDGDALLRHLRGRGFTEDELVTAGLTGRSQRGSLYDRFRGRLVWPIRDVTGAVIAFGARRLFDDDRIEAKYVNSPETPVYKKSQALYGIDLAKREIAKRNQLVVVEGYTDVMACHLAGVPTAVATCGTAFGEEHVRVARRLLGDQAGAEVIFTFDGDEAGQKAALRAFELDSRFTTETYVAVEQSGMDPCDLRLAAGDAAVVALVAGRVPLFEFAVRSTLRRYDLDSEAGRLAALDAAAPVVAQLRDSGLRQRYAVQLDRWLGFMDERFVLQRVAQAARGRGRGPEATTPTPAAAQAPAPAVSRPDPRDPVVQLEQRVLACALQHPQLVAEDFDALPEGAFVVPVHRAVHDAIAAAGGPAEALPGPEWVARVLSYSGEGVAPLVNELAVADLPVSDESELERWAGSVVAALAAEAATRAVAELRRRLGRLDPAADVEEYQRAFAELLRLEADRRAWRDRALGG